MTDPRHCAECGLEEIRTEDGRTNISPFGLCVNCHVTKSVEQKAIVDAARPLPFDAKMAQTGERDA